MGRPEFATLTGRDHYQVIGKTVLKEIDHSPSLEGPVPSVRPQFPGVDRGPSLVELVSRGQPTPGQLKRGIRA